MNAGSAARATPLFQPATVTIYGGAVPYSVSPTGNLISYVVNPKVHVANLADLQTPAAEIPGSPSSYAAPVATWSPDGKFISVTDDTYQVRLVRVDGANLSTPLALEGTSPNAIYGAWQP